MAVLRIAGVEVAPPSEIQVGRFDLARTTRAASGRLVSDVIRAGVRRLTVVWRALPDPDLKEILDLLGAHKPFVAIEYEDAGEAGSMMATVDGEIQYGMAHRVRGVRYWTEISVTLEEQ